ncbi:MAG TPA: methyltransferase domain-containing protein [Syntrophales bacterium]|nr:methyltransferase domain-containing protein [Syntrophales bacterium]
MNDVVKNDVSLAYTETATALSIRIRAHKEYSNFSLEDWLAAYTALREGSALLDLGCGSGNIFPLYSDRLGPSGLVVGIDQNEELLEKARTVKMAPALVLLRMDLNQPLPFLRGSFDHAISTFAIYYVDDPSLILGEVRRVLKESGEMVLVGPAAGNAGELYTLNEAVFGYGRDEKVTARTTRLEKEFHPLVASLFDDVRLEKIPSRLVFPNKRELVKYYMSTLLFEESVKKTGFSPTEEDLMAMEFGGREISKEMVVLRGKKSG